MSTGTVELKLNEPEVILPMLPNDVNRQECQQASDEERLKNEALERLKQGGFLKSFGTVSFPGNNDHEASFIRIEPDANKMDIIQYLFGSKRPSLVISITGGTKKMYMKSKYFRAFRNVLLKIAQIPGVCIITGGLDITIMGLIGKVIQKNRYVNRSIFLIGCTTWSCVHDSEEFNGEDKKVCYNQLSVPTPGKASLEPNHTAFILVEGDQKRNYDQEIGFRAKFEQELAGGFFPRDRPIISSNVSTSSRTSNVDLSEQQNSVPVVLLVVEGGQSAFKIMKETITESKLPIIILNGTGRLCNLFSKAYEIFYGHSQKQLYSVQNEALDSEHHKKTTRLKLSSSQMYSEEALLQDAKDEIFEKLGDQVILFFSSTNSSKDKRQQSEPSEEEKRKFDEFFECLKLGCNRIQVIGLDQDNQVMPDINEDILKALWRATSDSGTDYKKGEKNSKFKILELALQLHQVDLAENYILELTYNTKDVESDLKDLFILALEHNQAQFVELCFDNNLLKTSLFEKELLDELYRSNEAMGSERLSKRLNLPPNQITKNFRQILKENELNRYLPKSLIEHIKHLGSPLNSHDNPDNRHRKSESRYNSNVENQRESSTPRPVESKKPDKKKPEDIEKELFFLFVIFGLKDSAFLFWSRIKNKICAALVSILICRAGGDVEENQMHYKMALEFEHLAVRTLDKIYQQDVGLCRKAIVREIEAYKGAKWLDLAFKAKVKPFLIHPAVQDVLNEIWYGYIERDIGDAKIVFSTIMIFPIYWLNYQREVIRANELDTGKSPYNNLNSSKRESKKRTIPSRSKFYLFFQSPFVKYLYNLYFQIIFLLLYSYMVLCDFFPLYEFPNDLCMSWNDSTFSTVDELNGNDHQEMGTSMLLHNSGGKNNTVPYGLERHNRPSIVEFILFVWVISLVCDEIQQLFSGTTQSLVNLTRSHYRSFWNQLDALAILLFFVGMILRFIPQSNCFCAAHIVLLIDLAIWFIRSLEIFTATRRLGPKVVMIGEMVNDLKFFILIFFTFILAFGTSFYGLTSGIQKFSWHLIRKVVNLAYWPIFGELGIREKFENNFTVNGYVAFVLLMIYATVISVLLLNLLIAMFSNTFIRLEKNTDRIWKHQRYLLVTEYLFRSVLPSPFALIHHILLSVVYLISKCYSPPCIEYILRKLSYKQDLYGDRADTESADLEQIEDTHGYSVYTNFEQFERKLLEQGEIDNGQSPYENIFDKIQSVEHRLQIMSSEHLCISSTLKKITEKLEQASTPATKTDVYAIDHIGSFEPQSSDPDSGDRPLPAARQLSRIKSNSNTEDDGAVVYHFVNRDQPKLLP